MNEIINGKISSHMKTHNYMHVYVWVWIDPIIIIIFNYHTQISNTYIYMCTFLGTHFTQVASEDIYRNHVIKETSQSG